MLQQDKPDDYVLATGETNSVKEIADKVNSYFGYKLINKIRLQTFNSAVIKEKKQNILDKSSK